MRFRVRHLLLLVLIASVAFFLLTKQVRIAKQLRASDAVLKFQFEFEQWEDERRYRLISTPQRPLLVRLLGADMASTIVQVSVKRANDPSEIAELCSQLPHLRTLSIKECPLSDDDIAQLATLRKLRGLHLNDTAITDRSADTLSRMKNLSVLHLGGTALSNETIDKLKKSLPKTRIWSQNLSGGFM